MTRINCRYDERDQLIANLLSTGKLITETVAINLDQNGMPQTCYIIVDDPIGT